MLINTGNGKEIEHFILLYIIYDTAFKRKFNINYPFQIIIIKPKISFQTLESCIQMRRNVSLPIDPSPWRHRRGGPFPHGPLTAALYLNEVMGSFTQMMMMMMVIFFNHATFEIASSFLLRHCDGRKRSQSIGIRPSEMNSLRSHSAWTGLWWWLEEDQWRRSKNITFFVFSDTNGNIL